MSSTTYDTINIQNFIPLSILATQNILNHSYLYSCEDSLVTDNQEKKNTNKKTPKQNKKKKPQKFKDSYLIFAFLP